MRRARLAAALLAAAAVLTGGATATAAERRAPAGAAAHAHQHAAASPAASPFQRENDTAMGRMMADMHSPGYSGNVDVDFLAMMIPHHQGAVDMARLMLEHGRDPVTRQLAEEIIAGQRVEIESMTRRLAMLRQAAGKPAVAEFPSLGGTRGP